MTSENISQAEQGLAALSLGQIDQAQLFFDQALQVDDDDMVYSLAEELAGRGFLDQAQKIYQHLLTKYPEEDQLKTALAEIAIEDDQTELAQEYLANINPNSSSYVPALMIKADLYQAEGLVESAQHCLQQAEQLAPKETVVQFALAEFYYTTAQYRLAINYYRSLLLAGERYLNGIDLASRIALAYAAIGNYDNAIGYLEQIKPELMSLDTKFQLALLYYQSHRDDEAIKLFEEILIEDSQYSSVYPYLGQAYEQAGEIEKAYQNYQLGLAADQTNVQLYRQAGKVAQQLGDFDAAEADFQAALAIDDQESANYLLLANFKMAQGEYQAVIDLIEQAQDKELVDPNFYWILALAYQKLDNYKQAQTYWDQALEAKLNRPEFLLDLASWYHEQGQLNQERLTLEHYLEQAPDDYEVQDRLSGLLLDD
ncbi:tetratricopeptide repeat protein [Convivina intestini]|uniref:Tetratricopeptide repeat protein n=1 Tax=Convivina intestini TaxID=1505726 RepID=A0A2U1DES8_9LACO|nr:tetratricopeptide repeat protein [Convivina intestini]PVY86193.1 tetratricopeptide repeat protein [Convivina intestini]CAH1851378.1 Beta-barrel assembly-enhancing protease [Convivina intestini]SDB81387.1 Tetratricopeptide repeat-containing protein [Leuconostocaceae bacterium R-53105]